MPLPKKPYKSHAQILREKYPSKYISNPRISAPQETPKKAPIVKKPANQPASTASEPDQIEKVKQQIATSKSKLASLEKQTQADQIARTLNTAIRPLFQVVQQFGATSKKIEEALKGFKAEAPIVNIPAQPAVKIPDSKAPIVNIPKPDPVKFPDTMKIDDKSPLKVSFVNEKGKAMSFPVASGGGGRGVRPATQASVINLEMATSGTEYSAKIPDSTKNLTIKLRSTSATLLVAYSEGGTVDSFTTLTRGQTYTTPEGMDLNDVTIYLQADDNTQVAEITYWI